MALISRASRNVEIPWRKGHTGVTMYNLAMKRLYDAGELVDVSVCPQVSPGVYLLSRFEDGKDYADIKLEYWIWSIGRDIETDKIYASTDCRFYQDPRYECLFLR